jgi:hypothetical protein
LGSSLSKEVNNCLGSEVRNLGVWYDQGWLNRKKYLIKFQSQVF